MPGEQLFHQGESADSLYVIESGLLESAVRLPAERELSLAPIGAGEVIGELALLGGGSRSATVRAVEPTTGVVIERRAFDSLRASMRPSARAVMRSLYGVVCERLRHRYAAIAEQLGAAEGPTPRRPHLPQARPVTTADRHFGSQLPFFRAFLAAELDEVLDQSGRLELARGDLLACAGNPLDAYYLTLRGAVEATIQRGERKQRVRLAGPGASPAYLGLIDDFPSPVECRARERAVILPLPRARFRELVEGDDPLAHRFLDAVHQDIVRALRSAERRQATLISARAARPASR